MRRAAWSKKQLCAHSLVLTAARLPDSLGPISRGPITRALLGTCRGPAEAGARLPGHAGRRRAGPLMKKAYIAGLTGGGLHFPEYRSSIRIQ
jgi:hypothetical protein